MIHLIVKITGVYRWYWTACLKKIDITLTNDEIKFTTNKEQTTCKKCKKSIWVKN